MQAIIYNNDNGGVSVVYPTGELAIEEVAKKDVPAGKPYKIVDAKDIPSDRTFRDAWEANITDPDGVGIGADAWFAEQEVEDDNNQSE
jgi:hypothetical protein